MKQLLIESQRITGERKMATLIDPERFNEFFAELRASSIELKLKVFLGVAVSCGARVTEALRLQVVDIDSQGYVRIKVLKKRSGKQQYRTAKLHPIVFEMVQEFIAMQGLRHFSKLFDFSRSWVHRKIKEHFGEHASSHTIARHSFFSFLLHNKGLSSEKVSKLMEVSQHVVAAYNHLNTKQELDNLFNAEAA